MAQGQDSGPVDFSSLGGAPAATLPPVSAAPSTTPVSQPDTSSGPVNFSSLGGRPINSPVSAAATAATTQTTPDAAPEQPWYVNALNKVGEAGAGFVPGAIEEAGSTIQSIPYVGKKIITPEAMAAERAYFAPKSEAEQAGQVAGKVGEGVLEFVLGDEALKGLSMATKVKLAGSISKISEASPYIGKLIEHGVNAAKSGPGMASETGLRQGLVAYAQARAKGATHEEAMKAAVTAGLIGGSLEGLTAVQGAEGVSPKVKAGASVGKVAIGTGIAAQGANQALTPQQPGETSEQSLRRQLEGATQVYMGGRGAVEGLPEAKQAIQDRSAAKANKVSGEDLIAANQDFKKAIPQTKTNPYGDNDLAVANNYLEQHHVATEPIRGVQHTVDALDYSIDDIEKKVADHVKIIPNEPIATDVLDDVRSALEQNERGDEFVNAGLKEVEGLNLDNITMERADNVRRQLNLENKAILKKNNYDLAAARAADPGFAAREAAAESLRNGIYNQLEAHGIEGVRELRQEEGSLLKVRNAAQAQLFNGDKTIKGTGGASVARRVAGRAVQAAGTAAGAGAGAAIGGVPGAMIGGSVGAGLGEEVRQAIVPADLTRDEVLERRFNDYKAATGQPIQPTVDLHAPAPPEVPVGTQQQIPPPIPPATKGVPEQPSLFGTTNTKPSQQSPQVERQLLQQKIRPLRAILESPTATAAEKIEAARQIAKLGLGQFANPEIPQAGLTPEQTAEAAKTPLNPTKATEESALGSKTQLETRQPGESTEIEPINEQGKTDHAQDYIHPDTLTEPAREIPAKSRPNGTTSQTVHEHEFGGHLANAAVEGFSADNIIGSDHPEAGRRTVAAVTVNWDGLEQNDKGQISKQAVRDNIHKIMSVTMGGAAQDLLNGIPVEKNQSLSQDLRFARGIAKQVGFTSEQTEQLIQAGLERAKKNLTQPGMQDTIKSNAKMRESNLDPGLIASPERTQGLVNEFRRTHEENGNKIGEVHGQSDGEAVQGNSSRNAARGAQSSQSHDARREGIDASKPLEVHRGLKERTTGDNQADEAIRSAGAIPAGEMMNLALFHDPKTGSTLALDKREVTSDLVQKHLDESREKFGVKTGLSAENSDAPEVAEKAVQEAKKSGGGFVADLRTGKPTDTGFLVEVMPEKRQTLDHDATPKDLQKFYNDNRQLFKQHPELRIGGYKNELNISAHTDDQAVAEKLAKKLDQRSVWDVKSGKEIQTGGKGKQTKFADYPFQERIKELHSK